MSSLDRHIAGTARAYSRLTDIPAAEKIVYPRSPNDHAALQAACAASTGLCTIVGIEGSFSRRLRAQLAIDPEGRVAGSLSDGCLERELAAQMEIAREQGSPRVMRFGRNSPLIDFRLPCGSGLDILIDPAPDRAALESVVATLDRREAAEIELPVRSENLLIVRRYVPRPRLLLFGHGPELEALPALARAAVMELAVSDRDDPASVLALGQNPPPISVDPWTAIVLLFHDHEWELPILQWAIGTPAFLIGAQGGETARGARQTALRSAGLPEQTIARIASPIGLIPQAREPGVLALSVLAQLVAEYEALHPHG